MTATPDAFSTADLEALLENALPDVTSETEDQEDDSRIRRLCTIAESAINDVADVLDGKDTAQVHKVMIHMLIQRMFEWHTSVSEHAVRDGDTQKIALGWARDAGKFQAIMNILTTIEVGDDDFTCVAQ